MDRSNREHESSRKDGIDTDTFLERWYSAKQDLSKLEKRCNEYKKCAEKLMDRSGKDRLSGKKYEVTRKKVQKKQISKKETPVEIWNRYSNVIEYNMYIVNKK